MVKYKLINLLSKILYVMGSIRTPDNWQKINKCDILFVLASGDCGYIHQGKAYSPLLDSVNDLCRDQGLRTASVYTHFSKLIGLNTYNTKISYNRRALMTALSSRIARLFLGHEKSVAWTTRQRETFWGRILDIAKPVCVIGIQPNEGLCRAGKLKGIPVYDFQHGVIDDKHPWYGSDYCRNKEYGALVNGFFCWDEASASTLLKWAPQKGIDVRVVGNPWFSRFEIAHKNDLLVQEALNSGQIFGNGRPVVLVSLQWGTKDFYDKYSGYNGFMIDALEQTILETGHLFNWLLRLHPIQMRGSEKMLSQKYLMRTFGHMSSVEWRISSELPLPVVLKQADLHITESSSVVVEASWMGIRSALLNDDICPGGAAESYYANERECGLAEVIKPEANTIKQWIVDTYKKGRGTSTFKDSSEVLSLFIDSIASKVRQ